MTAERVVAVLGYSRRRDTGLHPVCADRLAHAQRLAAARSTVILSGESELMRDAWAGPDVVLVCDPVAHSTADNARNVAAAARELGVEELVVVTSRWHRFRAGILLRAALRGSGVHLEVEAVNGSRPPLLLARELACLALLPIQLARLRLRRSPSGGWHGSWSGDAGPGTRHHPVGVRPPTNSCEFARNLRPSQEEMQADDFLSRKAEN